MIKQLALQSFSGISMQRTSRDCATKAVYNTKFKCESRKGICRPTFRQRGLGQLNLFTSLSRRAGKLQEGHLESEQQEEVIQNTEVRLFILRQSIQLESPRPQRQGRTVRDGREGPTLHRLPRPGPRCCHHHTA